MTASLTKHIRSRIKSEGIKARVRMCPAGGAVQVITPSYDARFTSDEIYKIAFIAKCNKLTMVRGDEIDPKSMSNNTGATEFNFYW